MGLTFSSIPPLTMGSGSGPVKNKMKQLLVISISSQAPCRGTVMIPSVSYHFPRSRVPLKLNFHLASTCSRSSIIHQWAISSMRWSSSDQLSFKKLKSKIFPMFIYFSHKQTNKFPSLTLTFHPSVSLHSQELPFCYCSFYQLLLQS